jgi:hypothetical protein
MTVPEDSSLPVAVITFEESLAAAPVAIRRVLGSETFVLIHQVAGIVAGLLAGVLLSIALTSVLLAAGAAAAPSSSGELIIGIGAICGWALGLSRAQRAHQRRFLAAIRKRGGPREIAATFGLEGSVLKIDTPRVAYRVSSDAILDIIEAAHAWLIQVDITTFYLPKRAFGNETQEHAFIEQLLEIMEPDARARSDRPTSGVLSGTAGKRN